MDLFSAVTAEDMRVAQIVTGAAMAAFIGVGLVPALSQHAWVIRGALLALYLLTCGVYLGYVLLR